MTSQSICFIEGVKLFKKCFLYEFLDVKIGEQMFHTSNIQDMKNIFGITNFTAG
eukprot:TRINITY_DN17464_c0_g1_i1.p2 TRINITY_DN17464_c0_g1~~TRINITY_DN17464_c0_g1_i1.p2  ORF type:complete len:54 (+),score=11.53 TRINITY_DN17464_c0_g1_i1:335-496(+)